jgi:hypothetical protein
MCTFSHQQTGAASTHATRQNKISGIKTHSSYFTKNFPTTQASSLQYAHQNQTSYLAKLLAQRKVSTTQPSLSKELTFIAIYLCISELI